MEIEEKNSEAGASSSDRREFLKRMVVAGAFAAPVIAAFARGARGSNSLQNALPQNSPAQGESSNKLGSPRTTYVVPTLAPRPTIGGYSNASVPVPMPTAPSRTKNGALPVTTTKPRKSSTTTTTVKRRTKGGPVKSTTTTPANVRNGHPGTTTKK